MAVIPVVLFHGGARGFEGGFVGVDVFFVISGYLITSIIKDDIVAGTFSVVSFYERRVRRILPAIFAVCIACVPFAWLWMFPQQYVGFSRSLVAVVTFLSNFLFWRESGYFEAAAELKPLLHTWSLSVEEQFYLFFPLLLVLLARYGWQTKAALLAVVAVVSFGAAVYGSYAHPSAAYFLLPTRAWELGVGGAIALTSLANARLPTRALNAMSLAGVASIVYAVVAFDETTPFPGAHALLPVVGTAMIIVGARDATPLGRLLGMRLLVGIGLISYSLYLWHQPVFAFLRLRSPLEPSPWVMAVGGALSFLLAILTWRLVERPFRDRRIVSSRGLAWFVGACTAALLVAGLLGHWADGFARAGAKREAAGALFARLDVNDGMGEQCDVKPSGTPDCVTGTGPSIVVWGDSYAMHLVDAVRTAHPDAQLLQLTRSYCGPVLGIAPVSHKFPPAAARECLDFNGRSLEVITRTPSIRYAVLSSPFSQYLDEATNFMTEEGAVDPDAKQLVESFLRTLDTLVAAGIEPVVVSPPPTTGRDLGQCVIRSRRFGEDATQCDFERGGFEARSAEVLGFLKAIEAYHRVIWLADWICNDHVCRASVGDVIRYRDAGHLSREGAAELGRRIRFLPGLSSGGRATDDDASARSAAVGLD